MVIADRQLGQPTADSRQAGLPAETREALRLFDEWMAEPDDMGHEWWEDFRKWLADNRLNFTRTDA